jgi:hypothetical protein
MESLIINNKGQFISRKALGAFWIVLGIIVLLLGKGPLDQKDWMKFLIFFVIGLIHFTPLIGSSKSQIDIRDGCLSIIWFNWIRKVTIQESEIEGIKLATNGISISRKDKKPLNIKFMSMDTDQKKQVYDFFISYSGQKNFILDRPGN